MTTHIRTTVPLGVLERAGFDGPQRTETIIEIVHNILTVMLGVIPATRGKEIRTRRTYGKTIYFARSGASREVYVSLTDEKASGLTKNGELLANLDLTIGVTMKGVSEEKFVALYGSLALLGLGTLSRAETYYAGAADEIGDLFSAFIDYDPEMDVEPLRELAPDESPF